MLCPPRSVHHRLAVVVAFVGAVVSFSGRTDAAVVYGNLGAANEQSLDLGFNFNIGQSGTATNFLAQGFTTGTSPSFLQIESVVLGFGAPANGATPVVQLRAASGLDPSGSVLGTFTGPALTTTDKYTYTLPSLITLTPSTNYFIVVSDGNAGSGGNFNWYFQDGDDAPTELNGSGYSFQSTRKSSDGASTWSSGGVLAPGTAIGVVAVPEPPAMVLAGMALAAGICGFGRWRRA